MKKATKRKARATSPVPEKAEVSWQPCRLTVEQALVHLSALWSLAKQDEEDALSWVASDLASGKSHEIKKEIKEKIRTRANTTAWLAPLILQAQNATDPTVRKKLREQIKAQQEKWQATIAQRAQTEQEATFANACKALEALGSDKARGEALHILETAVYAQWERHEHPRLVRPTERARCRAERAAKVLDTAAQRFRAAVTGKRGPHGKVTMWGALSHDGDALPDAPLLIEANRKVNEAQDAVKCWRQSWQTLKAVTKKQSRPGHPGKPELAEAMNALLRLYGKAGVSQKSRVRDHTIALLHAAGLSNTAIGDAVKGKAHSLKKSSRSLRL